MAMDMQGMGGGGNAGLFGGGAPAASAGPKDYSSLFEDDGGEGETGDPLMSALADAGYDVTPDKLEQIKAILGKAGAAEGGMAPAGMESTSSGPEAMRSAP